jgi:hypothetical protein
VGHTVKRCPQPEETAFGGADNEASWEQTDDGKGDDVETVRQGVEETSFW